MFSQAFNIPRRPITQSEMSTQPPAIVHSLPQSTHSIPLQAMRRLSTTMSTYHLVQESEQS